MPGEHEHSTGFLRVQLVAAASLLGPPAHVQGFNACTYQRTHPVKANSGHRDADATLVSPHGSDFAKPVGLVVSLLSGVSGELIDLQIDPNSSLFGVPSNMDAFAFDTGMEAGHTFCWYRRVHMFILRQSVATSLSAGLCLQGC